MLSDFENKVADFIKANRLCESADKILLAVSGGADSTALLHVMATLRTEGFLNAELLCAHINHQLRAAEADRDENFVIEQAGELKLPVTTKRIDVRGCAQKNKLSIETTARQLRIGALIDIARANECKWVATAHQENDNAETVLHRLLRGTGLRGLGGIRPMQLFDEDIEFVRPLLCVERDEIVQYLKERNLKWHEDRTNYDCTYRRNFIRHRLMPTLQQDCTGSLVEQLFQLSQSSQRFYSLVCSCADEVWPTVAEGSSENPRLDVREFLAQPPAVRVELVRRSLAGIGSGERNLTQEHFERILQLAKQEIGGRKVELPGGFVVCREYEKLTFGRIKDQHTEQQTCQSVEIEIPGQTRFGNYLVEAAVLEADVEAFEKFKAQKNESVEWFDLDKLKPPLLVRLRQTGDRFWPLGSPAEKKVGKFLTAARVPQGLRKRTLIVTDAEKIIWLWPIRMSEQARINARTRNILQLQIIDMPPT